MVENKNKALNNTTPGNDMFSAVILKYETNPYNEPNRDKLVDTLNALIEINNDRIAGYEYAKKETKEAELKTLFNQFISTSTKCKEQLVHEIQELGAIPTSGSHKEGPFFKAWMDLEVVLTGHDPQTILNTCTRGEELTTKAYRYELDSTMNNASNELMTILNEQFALIQIDQDKITGLGLIAAEKYRVGFTDTLPQSLLHA